MLLAQRHDIGSHPRGLGVDINPDDPHVRHCHGCADDETGLRAGTSGAMHDSGRSEAQMRGLRSISAIVVA